MMLIFVPWDIWFTSKKIWFFNANYTLGFSPAGIPIEEWLFFPVTNFAVFFLYECVHSYFNKNILKNTASFILLSIAVSGLILAIINYEKWYTSMKIGGCSFLIFTTLLFLKPKNLNLFLFTYLLSLIPFLFMNGALTGMFTAKAIVGYNPEHIMNIRVFTIPVEDFFYSLFMLLFTFNIYSRLRHV